MYSRRLAEALRRKIHDLKHSLSVAVQHNQGRRTIRKLRRRMSLASRQWRKLKSRRTRLLCHQSRVRTSTRLARLRSCQTFPKLATWNTRGLRPDSTSPGMEVKMKCIIQRMVLQKWGCLVLTDVKGPDGLKEYRYLGRTWYFFTQGRVGFLLEDIWHTWWTEGGSRFYPQGSRTCGLQFPRRGRRRGLFLVGVYAPTSDSSTGNRQTLRDQVSNVLSMCEAPSLKLVLGDLNAEMGNSVDTTLDGFAVMGRFSNPKLSVAGKEWRVWAEKEGMVECSSRFQLRHRWTWRHPRFLSLHELDHILLSTDGLWHLVSCRVLQEGPNVLWPWTSYTDHNPVEVTLRHGKLWPNPVRKATGPVKPDINKLRGPSNTAQALRKQWVEAVEEKLAFVQANNPHQDSNEKWDLLCTTCREAATRICGVLTNSQGAPWLRGKDHEVQQLDRYIVEAQNADRTIRHNPTNLPPDLWQQQCRLKRHQLQQARKYKREQLNKWEEDWLNAKAEEATRASDRHYLGDLFGIIRELSNLKDSNTRFGLRKHLDPQAEAEAWKAHFEAIQLGAGQDRNTWRGITLLSVGSKLVARVCAARLLRWCSPWLNETQFGFRKGTGLDDVQQLTRSILEEAAGSAHDRTVVFRFYDLEKAYPKLARHGLWQLLHLKGCPPGFLRVLQRIHNTTSSKVRFQGVMSSGFLPDRGLREGCPSSPILFNIYHHGIMEVFRARRTRLALGLGLTPGVLWDYKVDGKIGKRRLDRLEEGRNVRQRTFGDFAYADDTALVGDSEEIFGAEKVFLDTISDFAGKVNAHKTEGLRVTSTPPAPYDVQYQGEATHVKHVGAVLSHRGNHVAETQARVTRTVQKLGWVAGAWSRGRGAHKNKYRVSYSVRIKVMKAVVKGILCSFSKTRAWQMNQLSRVQKTIHMAIRRCIGARLSMLHVCGLNNHSLRRLAQWESFDQTVRGATLIWIGHVAWMSVSSPQKAAMYGWLHVASAKPHAPPRQAQWINSCLRAAGIPEGDWFRRAQNREAWRAEVYRAFPPETLKHEHSAALDNWRPGQPVPDFAKAEVPEQDVQSNAGSEQEIGERRRGRARHRARREYRHGNAQDVRTARAHRNDRGEWACPVCQQVFDKANQATFHYEEHHAIADPHLVTVQSFPCNKCGVAFRRQKQFKTHTCPANTRLPRLDQIDDNQAVCGPIDPHSLAQATQLYLYTDGSGGQRGTAGWGVGVFTQHYPQVHDQWLAALYGPVLIQPFDPLWLGADHHSNNTGELSAIGEACRWLLTLLASPRPPPLQKVRILYDSTYAYSLATRLAYPHGTIELANKVARMVEDVRTRIHLDFEHVRAHTDIHGNEVADRLANRGAEQRISPHHTCWLTIPEGPLGAPPAPAAPPRRPCSAPARQRCNLRGEDFRPTDIVQRRPICRGPDPANRTCHFCHKVLKDVQTRKNHERYTHPNEALAAGLISTIPKKGKRG